jgi:cytochrome c-type biogenesis protein CcmH
LTVDAPPRIDAKGKDMKAAFRTWLRKAAVHVLLAVVLGGLAMALSYERVAAQDPTPSDDQVNQIAHQLYCPVCENTPLDVCPTEACRQWRDLIRQQLSEGWSQARIKQYFVDQYGARVLAEPPRSGLNWLVYILPPLIILGGVFVLLRALRSWTRTQPPAAAGGAKADGDVENDEYVARLEDELKKRQ